MSNYSIDMRDVRFILYEQLGLEDLTKHPKYADFNKELFEMVLDEAYKMAREDVSPLNEVGDRAHCKFEGGQVFMPPGFKEVYKKFSENGWVAPSAPAEWGGQSLPDTLALSVTEMFTGACCAFMMTPGLTVGAANLILSFGTDELKNIYLEKMYTGEWSGTMCLTEESAGSAVGDLRSKAKKEGDHYLIEGTKIFISSGEHDLADNIVHLVLARTEGAPKGTGGLSLFVVPKVLVNEDGTLGERNDMQCTKIEDKMGINGSATCVLNFGDNGACKGWLLGEECKGMRAMFQMMNEARLYVGLQGQSQAGLAYQEALTFARERIQGTDIRQMRDVDAKRVPIIVHPDVRRMLMTQRAYTEAMRSMLYTTAFYVDKIHTADDPAEKNLYKGLLDIHTPICKAWCSDMGFRVAELAMQTMGGYGYIQEYPAEQILRDVKIAGIYEGTNGIQALDLLGRKVSGKGGLLFMQVLQFMNEWLGKNKDNENVGKLVKAVDDAKNALAEVTFTFAGMGRKDPLYPVLNAYPYLLAFGDILGGFYMAQQAVIADEKFHAMLAAKGIEGDEAVRKLVEENPEAQFYYNKVKTAEFYIYRLLPKAMAQIAGMKSGDRSSLEVVFPEA